MSATSPGAAPLDSTSPPTSRPFRVITPRRSLPGSRAVAGGLLVAIAAIGTFAVAAGATSDGTEAFVVAARDLPAGTRLQPSDVTTVELKLSPQVAERAFRSAERTAGATLVGPVHAGELVQAGSLMFKVSGGAQREMSFSVPASRALGGAIASGETIDILATDEGAATHAARTAVAGARVIRSDRGSSGGLGNAGDVTITVALTTPSEAAALAAAVDGGQITVVRTTGVSPPASSASPTSAGQPEASAAP